MRIALTADPELPVPPKLYGGIERIVDMLARGLVARGHEVTLFAHAASDTAGHHVAWPGLSSRSQTDTLRNMTVLASKVYSGQFDIVHSFSRIAYLTPILPAAVPKIMSYQRAVSPHTVSLGHRFSRGTLSFTAISHWMMEPVKEIGQWTMVPNGVPLETFQFNPEVAPDAPLVFLGRLEEIKGPHLAIGIAKRAGRRLIIAGNIPLGKESWVQKNVLSHVDGDKVMYIGPVDDSQKNALLGSAAAFLMPILWEEPFGIVMAEALACGTPVIGLRRGAVPEVVEQGVSGFVEDSVDGLVAAVARIKQIDRKHCRERAHRFYSATAVVDAYELLYSQRISNIRR